MLFRSQRQPTRPGRWCGRILHSPGLTCYRRLPLSSHVRPRMPTFSASSPLFWAERRAQIGTKAFVACGQHRTTSSASASNQQPLFSAHHLSWRAAPASFAKPCGSCRLGAFFLHCRARLFGFLVQQHLLRGGLPPQNVRGLTPRSSGAPTAAHQARSVVPEHSPQPGPGVLPLSPA